MRKLLLVIAAVASSVLAAELNESVSEGALIANEEVYVPAEEVVEVATVDNAVIEDVPVASSPIQLAPVVEADMA